MLLLIVIIACIAEENSEIELVLYVKLFLMMRLVLLAMFKKKF